MHWLLARVLRLYPDHRARRSRRCWTGISRRSRSPPSCATSTPGGQDLRAAVRLGLAARAAGRAAAARRTRGGPTRCSRSPRARAPHGVASSSGAPYPIRAGSHGNTAFACLLALDYARAAKTRRCEKRNPGRRAALVPRRSRRAARLRAVARRFPLAGAGGSDVDAGGAWRRANFGAWPQGFFLDAIRRSWNRRPSRTAPIPSRAISTAWRCRAPGA